MGGSPDKFGAALPAFGRCGHHEPMSTHNASDLICTSALFLTVNECDEVYVSNFPVRALEDRHVQHQQHQQASE